MHRKIALLVTAVLVFTSLVAKLDAGDTKEVSLPVPNARQLAWQDAELGVVFHYDLHVFDGKKYGQGGNRITPIADYNIFAPWTKLLLLGKHRK